MAAAMNIRSYKQRSHYLSCLSLLHLLEKLEYADRHDYKGFYKHFYPHYYEP